jgi:hypothetical protein
MQMELILASGLSGFSIRGCRFSICNEGVGSIRGGSTGLQSIILHGFCNLLLENLYLLLSA